MRWEKLLGEPGRKQAQIHRRSKFALVAVKGSKPGIYHEEGGRHIAPLRRCPKRSLLRSRGCQCLAARPGQCRGCQCLENTRSSWFESPVGKCVVDGFLVCKRDDSEKSPIQLTDFSPESYSTPIFLHLFSQRIHHYGKAHSLCQRRMFRQHLGLEILGNGEGHDSLTHGVQIEGRNEARGTVTFILPLLSNGLAGARATGAEPLQYRANRT